MPRSKVVFTAPIVLAVIIIGVFAIRSRSDNHANVDTTSKHNCPPVARPDVAATKPGAPIAIDVLANDTDPDGDPLVFHIRSTVGGQATIDDGGTPTDASDDRVLFTPADPPPPSATIQYQAIDLSGALSESTVTVFITPDGSLPAGQASAPVPADAKSAASGCGASHIAAGTTTTVSIDPGLSAIAPPPSWVPGQDHSGGRVDRARHADHTSTTVHVKDTPTSRDTNTTERPRETATTAPPTTQPYPTTTGTTEPDPCGAYPINGSQTDQDKWRQCEKDRGTHHG